MVDKNRICWIDVLKGLLLVLICIGHFGNLPCWVAPIIHPTGMFYVPIFFMLSGYLLSVDGRTFQNFLHRKVQTLLIPYLFFSVVFIVLDWNTWLQPATYIQDNLYRFAVLGTGAIKASPLWFVIVLFVGDLFCFAVLRCTRRMEILLPIICVLSACAYAFCAYDVHLPWLFHLLPSVLILMLSGYLLRSIQTKLKRIKHADILMVIIVSGGVILANAYTLGDMHLNKISNYPLFYICPLSVGSGIIWFVRKTEKFCGEHVTYPLRWVATNGIVILACHVYIAIVFDAMWAKIGIGNDSLRFIAMFFVVFLTLCFVVVPVVNKYFYWFIGRKKSNGISSINLKSTN